LIGLDTNVLVRFLVRDDANQSKRAASLIGDAVRAGDALYVSDIVLCETVWVLAGSYGFDRGEISDTLGDLLRARHLSFSNTDRIGRALRCYRSGAADFADYLIREHAVGAGCDSIATFDRALLRERGFIAPR
jgi:predicted nucleic-acid-binding protein